MSRKVKDHFSKVADQYADSRPTYPPEVFAWLASQCPQHELAWDCGAGNGQASRELARHFEKVLATDASQAQIAEAKPHAGIEYRVTTETDSGLGDHCADLVVVAQAMHWFNLDRFYAEVRRVLKPAGLLAALTYGVHSVEGKEVDARAQAFYRDDLGPYWPPERHHVETGYRDLPFPFKRLTPPSFAMAAQWHLDELLGYFRSWSATGRYIEAKGVDPVQDLDKRLRPVWGPPQMRRRVEWPLTVLVGRPDGG